MNPLLMLLLLAPNALTGLGATAGGSSASALLPLMLMSGGRMNQMGMLGLLTGNSTLTLMGMMQGNRRRSYRRRTRVVYVRSRY